MTRRQDVQELVAELAAAAFLDPLTGLRNRRGLEEDLRERLALAVRGGRPLTVVMADLDGLKAINDRHGHPAGDEALCGLGGAIKRELRAGDTAYRVGGDEFLLVLPDTGAAEAESVIARVRATAPSFGWGTATSPADGVDGAGLIELADQRLIGRRSTRRTQSEHRQKRIALPRRAGRAASAALLVVGGVMSGVGVGFAADSILDRGPSRLSADTSGAVSSPPEGASNSVALADDATTPTPDHTGTADRAAAAATTAPATTSPTTAAIVASLVDRASHELDSVSSTLLDPEVIVVPDVPEPAEVLGEVVELGSDLISSPPAGETESSDGQPSHGKPHRPTAKPRPGH